MEISTQKKVLRVLLGIMLALQIALVVSVYIIATNEGYLELPKIYLSSAFRRDPARAVAAFLLPLTSIIYGIILGQRLWNLYPFLRDDVDGRIYWAAVVGLACAVVGMVGVAAVALDLSKLIHWITASITFGGSTAVMITLSLLERRLRLSQPSWLSLAKWIMTGLACISLVMMGTAALFSYLVGSIFEFILAAVFTAYLVCLVHDSSFPLITKEKIPKSPRPTGREVDDQL
jgi:hypothetical protein